MAARDQMRVAFHGSIVLLLGFVAGIPYGSAITQSWGERTVGAWHAAHTGLTMGGIMMLALAALLPGLVLGDLARRTAAWCLVASGYGFSAALLVGAIIGERGIALTGPASNVLVYLANALGAVGSVLAVMLVLHGARARLRAAR